MSLSSYTTNWVTAAVADPMAATELVNIVNHTGTVGFFGAGPVAQQTGGVAAAGGTYTATEQGMINAMYTALRAYGLLT